MARKRKIYIIALIAVILCGVGLLIALVVTLTKTSDDNKPQFTSSAGSTTADPPPSTADNNSSAYGDYRYATVTSDTQACSSIGVLACYLYDHFVILHKTKCITQRYKRYNVKVLKDNYYEQILKEIILSLLVEII